MDERVADRGVVRPVEDQELADPDVPGVEGSRCVARGRRVVQRATVDAVERDEPAGDPVAKALRAAAGAPADADARGEAGVGVLEVRDLGRGQAGNCRRPAGTGASGKVDVLGDRPLRADLVRRVGPVVGRPGNDPLEEEPQVHRFGVVAGQVDVEGMGWNAEVGPESRVDEARRGGGIHYGEEGVHPAGVVQVDFEVGKEKRGGRGDFVRANGGGRRARRGEAESREGGCDEELLHLPDLLPVAPGAGVAVVAAWGRGGKTGRTVPMK